MKGNKVINFIKLNQQQCLQCNSFLKSISMTIWRAYTVESLKETIYSDPQMLQRTTEEPSLNALIGQPL